MLRFAPECGPSMRVVRQRSLLRNSLGTMPWPNIRLEPDVSERRQAHLFGDARDVACAVAETSKLARSSRRLPFTSPRRAASDDPLDHGVARCDPGCEVGLVFRRSSRGPGRFPHLPTGAFFRVFDIRVLDIKRLMRDWLIVTRRRRQSLHGRSRICQVDHRCRRRSPDVDPYGPCAGEAQSTEIGRM
jgi:hypothetical protein